MFGPSQWNAEDIDDFLAMQRDWGVDGGLRTAAEAVRRPRCARRAVEAVRDGLPRSSGSPTSTTSGPSRRSTRPAPRTSPTSDLMTPLVAARTIRDRA